MAGEWIKMRVFLRSDPKVLGMADYLAMQPEFRSAVMAEGGTALFNNVTRNTVVSCCVTGLLAVWGMVNERGRSDGEDFVLEHADFRRISEIAGWPKFGEAMALVEWASEECDGDVSCVRFIHFVEWNTPSEERGKQQNRERQKRFRDRRKQHNDSNGGVTLKRNDRAEQSRVEQSRDPGIAGAQWIEGGCKGGESGESKARTRKPAPPKPDRRFKNQPPPELFVEVLDGMVNILGLHDSDQVLDQIGFLARLAYADASGFDWGRPIWDFVGRAKRKSNPAGWLTKALQDEGGQKRYRQFLDTTPSPAHCQWLLLQIGRSAGSTLPERPAGEPKG
jgi:hypothetical protein